MKDLDERKSPSARSFTLSGGSFREEIIIDHVKSRPDDIDIDIDIDIDSSTGTGTGTRSLPAKFNHSVSLDTNDNANETVAPSTTSSPQIKPDVEELEVRLCCPCL
jgi:hypothetical protein